jgi:hypothetical protein
MTPPAIVIQGDARHLPLPDRSVDLIVTSPPYFGLRSYQDGGQHYAGQIGSEPTPREFLDALWECTAEWCRVLKPEGSLWVNLGDKYSQRTQTRRSSHQPGIFPGKLPGSVWTIPTAPLTVPESLGVDHFAAFPIEWPLRIIRGWSPTGVCCACGQGRRPVTATSLIGGNPFTGRDYRRLANGPTGGPERPMPGGANLTTITGYVCACPTPNAPTTHAVILDPFGGTGTTALAAKALGRTGISVDLSHDYTRLAAWRTNDPAELAKAMRVDKPPTQVDGQQPLFEVTP